MQCNECNKELGEGSSFCQYCGKKIEFDFDKSSERIEEYLVVQSMFFCEYPKIHKKYVKYNQENLKKIKAMKKNNPEKYDIFVNSLLK